jgi:hypothetical protein
VMVPRHPEKAGDGSRIDDRQWVHCAHRTPFLLLRWLGSWIHPGRHATSRAASSSMGCNPTRND